MSKEIKHLVRTHLLCPYSDCRAYFRADPFRIQVLLDKDRNVTLQKPKDMRGSRLPYLYRRWVKPSVCPYCEKKVEVIIDETHQGRNIYLRKK